MSNHSLITLGWREWLSLPSLDIPLIAAKIDTGARTSCLHAYDVKPFVNEGAPWVEFALHPLQQNTEFGVLRQVPVLDQRQVTDSGGHTEERYVIQSDIAINGQEWPIEITLTNRDTMRFRMLLGRTAMNEHCVVNPALSWQLGERSQADFKQAWQHA